MKRVLGCLIICSMLCMTGCESTQLSKSSLGNTLVKSVVHKPVDIKKQMVSTFLDDAQLLPSIHREFYLAIGGSEIHQEKMKTYSKQWAILDDIFTYRYPVTAFENYELSYAIGQLYMYGNQGLAFQVDEKKALSWFLLGAEEGSTECALEAARIFREENPERAVEMYYQALALELTGTGYYELATCYEEGIGVAQNLEIAEDLYMKALLSRDSKAAYRLLSMKSRAQEEQRLLAKIACSMDFRGNYFDMVYGGLEGYDSKKIKIDVMNDLISFKDYEITFESEFFEREWIEKIGEVFYTYGYHDFVSTNGIEINKELTDDDFINFQSPDEAPFVVSDYYEIDFDNDGLLEIGIPVHSGAGGAFMADGFEMYKKNNEGQYVYLASGPYCTLRDAMRLVKFDEKVYFLTNPYDDTGDEAFNVTVLKIGDNGERHELMISPSQTSLKQVMRKVYDDVSLEDLSVMDEQIKEAVQASKHHILYHSVEPEILEADELYFSIKTYEDTYYSTDYDQDGDMDFIRKSHIIDASKYYNDVFIVQAYDSLHDILNDEEDMLSKIYEDDFYGYHDGGNILDQFPIEGIVVQYWTYESGDKIYNLFLTRHLSVFGAHVYLVSDDNVKPIMKSLYFEEPEGISIEYLNP